MNVSPKPHTKKLFFNRPLRILLLTNALILIAGAMLGPIYALFVQKVGGDLLNASLAGAVFAFTAGLTVLLSGKYSDRLHHNKKYVVILGYTIIGIGFLLYTQVQTVWHLLLVQVLIGFGEAIYNPPYDALYTEHLDHNKSATEWGAWEAMNYFSIAIGALLGGLIANKFGFSPLFIFMAVLCFSSALYIWRLPKKVL